MMSRHFNQAKKLLHAKNQLSVTDSFFNQFVIYILTIKTRLMYIYLYTSALRACLRCWRTLCVRRRLPSVVWSHIG